MWKGKVPPHPSGRQESDSNGEMGGHRDPRLATMAAAYQPGYVQNYGSEQPGYGYVPHHPHHLPHAISYTNNPNYPPPPGSPALPAASSYWGQQPDHSGSRGHARRDMGYHSAPHPPPHHHPYYSNGGPVANMHDEEDDELSESSREEDDEDDDAKPRAREDSGGDDEDDDEDEDDPNEEDENMGIPAAVKPRGKPEAMAQALAAARLQANFEKHKRAGGGIQQDSDDEDDDDDDHDESEGDIEEVVAEPIVEAMAEPVAEPVDNHDDDDEGEGEPIEPERVARSILPGKKLVRKSKTPMRKPRKLKTSPAFADNSKESLLNEPVEPISEAEYENLETLMVQFCRVPLLAEFSRPVSLLHPELVSSYTRIVKHPVDLGHICRGIRRRQYKNSRDIRLDMWRVFANCVKFHSHPNNKEAVPSFVSIALHLREFFNNLWKEYMVPSDLNENASNTLRDLFMKRKQERKRNLENSGVLVLNHKITQKIAKMLGDVIENGGRVDKLDRDAVFGPQAPVQDRDLDIVVDNLKRLQQKLVIPTEEYTVENFHNDLHQCCPSDILEDNQGLRNRVTNRLNRFFWKLLIPLHEANSRGVTQSSIWGNIAATIWARESSKKPYWPALCLGILPPEDQREGWHDAVTERNEARLPEKLRAQLEAAKRKCMASQKRQAMSYFLVEFLGTHEFIWVRETDIVENFDPNNDPNKKAGSASKKSKRTVRSGTASVVGSKNYATALEECVWANEEYESVLQDAFGYKSDNEEEQEDGEEMNYSYSVLAQSDDEADDEDSHGFVYDDASLSMSDVDEANWLLAHEGLLDTSSTGRKNAKKRTQQLKKKKDNNDSGKTKVEVKKKKDTKPAKEVKKSKESKKKEALKAKEAKAKEAAKAKDREREQKKEQRELEKRRKRRIREREKALRIGSRKKRRRGSSAADEEDERGLVHDKRARSTAIVRAYLTRMAKDDQYKNLVLSGVMTIPTSMIDSTGLLGMALAFRASAGELAMPDDGGEHLARVKPWTMIDTKRPKTCVERIDALEKQAALLEKQIIRVRANTERRKDLAREAIAQRLRIENEIEADDKAARRNPYKKKKKYSTRPSKNAAGENKASEEAEADGDSKRQEDDDNTVATESNNRIEVDPEEADDGDTSASHDQSGGW